MHNDTRHTHAANAQRLGEPAPETSGGMDTLNVSDASCTAKDLTADREWKRRRRKAAVRYGELLNLTNQLMREPVECENEEGILCRRDAIASRQKLEINETQKTLTGTSIQVRDCSRLQGATNFTSRT